MNKDEDKFSLRVLWAIFVFSFLGGALAGGGGLMGAMLFMHGLCSK